MTGAAALLEAGWAARTEPIAWPGVPFDPPAGEAWIRFTDYAAASQAASIGAVGANAVTWRETGFVLVEVFVPEGQGDGGAFAIAEAAAAIFRGQTVGGLRLGAPTIERVGKVGAFYQLNVRVPYQRDEQH